MKAARNSSVELLRIIAMCGVVILHYNNEYIGGALNYAAGVNRSLLIVLESLFICAVNLYVLISGFFLCASSRRRLIKPLELIVQVCAFGALRFVLDCALTGRFSLGGLVDAMIPNNYFVSLYITLFLISPYLNKLYDQLSNRQLLTMTGLMLVLFSVWPTVLDLVTDVTGNSYNGMSTINAFGSQSGYTVVNFVLMYTLGACIRRNQESLKKLHALPVFLGCVAVLAVWSHFYSSSAWAYHNPLVILTACAALILFLRMEFSSKVINHLAKSTFTVFLFHSFFMGRIGIAYAVTSSLPLLLVHVLLSAVGIYLICHVAYLLWELATRWFFRLLDKPVSRLDSVIWPADS